MFLLEYTEYETKKVINIAMCHSIETIKHQTSSRNTFSLKIEFGSNSRTPTVTIDFQSEEQLDKAFEDLIEAIQESDSNHVKILSLQDM